MEYLGRSDKVKDEVQEIFDNSVLLMKYLKVGDCKSDFQVV